MADSDNGTLLLSMRGIGKRFPGVKALDGVNLTLHGGEVVALLGENGAGKSTLIKMLSGARQPDEGIIEIDGESVVIDSARAARDSGIAVIHQEFNLVPGMTVRENLFLGRERTRFGKIDHRTETKLAREWLARLGLDIDPEERCGDLSVARQQAVEIARALSFDARILVMDEPSAVLTDREVEKLFVNVRELRKEGIGIVYISHRLEEIDEIADRFLVLRDGKMVGEGRVLDSSRERLIELMVGRSLEKEFPPRSVEIGEEKLRVDRISQGKLVRDISFSVRAGEVVGFFGLVGAGRTETMRLVAGADRCDSGEVFVEGVKVSARNPREAISAGICLLSEDRKAEGLVQKHTAMSNFGLPNLRRFSHGLVLKDGEEREEFSEYVESLRIRVSVPEQLAAQLSGGNQQKVVIAKWLARNTEVILFNEPTRGIDVGAKFEIYQLMNKLAGEGKAIVMVSSELPEILGMSDRIIVMREGQIAGELENRDGLTQEEVLALAMEREVAA